MKTIKIIGNWWEECAKIEANVKIALEATGIKAEIIQSSNMIDQIVYGVTSNPWFVIDEKLICDGIIIGVEDIIHFLQHPPVEHDHCGCGCGHDH